MKNKIFVHGEQRPLKEVLQTKMRYISRTPMKISKQTPPNRGPFLISFLEKHSLVFRPPEKTSTRPIKMSLDTNPDLVSKVICTSESKKQIHESKVNGTMVE
jgi:hypothetical protein